MNQRLKGKVAVVTGGSSGIGLATAKLFVEEGAYVFITGRRQSEIDKAVKLIGKNAIGVQSDVSNLSDLDKLYQVVKEKKGVVDILFANAGGGKFAPLGEITEEHYDSIFNTNVKGLIFSVQKALPLMKENGSIILNASVAASKGNAAFSVYSASKAAVRSLARCWTQDLKERKIRVNVISPGYTITPIFDAAGLSQNQKDEFSEEILNRIPMGRGAMPEEIAKAVLLFASDDSSYITGAELCVDGGLAQV